ncbi:MAG: hypothetical protein ABSF78_10325, partial [Candidatus Acidiferrales bacterium]
TKTAVHSNTLILNIEPEFSIAVTPPADPIRLGMPINISVTVKNVSGKEIYWRTERYDPAYRNFNFFLRKDGREVETTFFHRKITSRQRPNDPSEVAATSSIVGTVAPGESFSAPIDLTRLYELTEPGVYTLDVGRYDENTKTSVFSNTLTLTIVP